MKWTPRRLKYAMRIYGPYLGAAVRVTHISEDWREFRVAMKMRWYNRNAFGVHFGGSLYAMVDPHLVIMLVYILGDDYIVWDAAASIEFVRPGKGTVSSTIRIDEQTIADIKEKTAHGQKYLPEFEVAVTDEAGEIVARIKKVLYVRRKSNH